VPAQTPAPVVNALSEAIASALQDPAVKARLEQQGNIRMYGPQRFAEQIDKETAQYAEIIRKADIKLD
jgi:tripartite-type tricarboxylate transporter receptor subunit TctC